MILKLRCFFILSIWVISINAQNPLPQDFPCEYLTGAQLNNFNGFLYSNCVEIGDVTNAVEIKNSQNVTIQAFDHITLKPGTNVGSFNQNGEFHGVIDKTGIEEISWFEPLSPGVVGKYNKMEVGIKFIDNIESEIKKFIDDNGAQGGINPFDLEEIRVDVQYLSPSNKISKRLGFYYEPFSVGSNGAWVMDQANKFKWRLRFAPDEIGLWNATVTVNINGEIMQANFQFSCINSSHKGYITTTNQDNENDRYLQYEESGETFFAIGNNVASAGIYGSFPAAINKHLSGIQDLIDVNANFTRIGITPNDFLPDWPNYKNYSTKLDEMYGLDKVIEKCELNDIYFILFRWHLETMLNENSGANAGWVNNPYKIDFNLTHINQYFLSELVKKWQKNCLAYIFARWGYTPNMAFFSYSEVDLWAQAHKELGISDYDQFLNLSVMELWTTQQQEIIKNDFGYDNAKFIYSYSTLPNDDPIPFFATGDAIGLHKYGKDKNINFKDRYQYIDKNFDRYNKPIIMEETGVGIGEQEGDGNNDLNMYCCTPIEYHNALWSTAMMGGFGAGMDWWWERIHYFGYHNELTLLREFFKDEKDMHLKRYKSNKDDNAILKNNRTIENYYLKSDDKERVLGWVHHAGYYWRNLQNSNSCLDDLITNDLISESCFDFYETEYNFNPVQTTDLDEEKYIDMFNGNVQNHEEGSIQNREITISGMKYNLGVKKHWYRIELYTLRPEQSSSPMINQVYFEHADLLFRLKFNTNILNNEHRDYAYKITYIGKSKNPNGLIIKPDNIINSFDGDIKENDEKNHLKTDQQSIRIEENLENLIIFPNPNNGSFTVKSNQKISKIEVYNINGEMLEKFENIDQSQQEFNLQKVSTGFYLIKVFLGSTYEIRKISIL